MSRARYFMPDYKAAYELDTEAPVLEKGWLATVRAICGKPAHELAREMDVQQSTLTRLEQGERNSTISMRSLRKYADALDCEVVYALVPKHGTFVDMSDARLKKVNADRKKMKKGPLRKPSEEQAGEWSRQAKFGLAI